MIIEESQYRENPYILITTGIKEELIGILENHPFYFDKEIKLYRSRVKPTLFATTLGPALCKRKEISAILKAIEFDYIINGGLVGILDYDDAAKPGDKLRLGTIIDQDSEIIYPGGPGQDTIVTVQKPIFEPWAKAEIQYNFKARAIEMEASRLIKLTGFDSPDSTIIFCKIAGDIPAFADLYENEHLIRGWQSMGLIEKLKIAHNFPGGIFSLHLLRKMKRLALYSLSKHLLEITNLILKEKGIPRGLDSVFIPH